MAIKTYIPITPTLRFQTTLTNDELTTDKPHKPLTRSKLRTGGRRNAGDITIWHRGGGHKRRLRAIDFKREKAGVPATVVSIEYDPNRSARIALIAYADGEKRYILHPVGLNVGQKIVSGPEADILVGNALPLKNIPPGTTVHNIELKPGKGAQMVRSAGGAAQLVAKEEEYALVKLPSGETRRVLIDCMATGRPVILAASGEAPRIISRTGAGVAVPPEDPTALVQAIRSLANDPEGAATMGRAGVRFARGRLRGAQAARLEAVLIAAVAGP